MKGVVGRRISADFLEFREAVGDPRTRNETVLTLDAKEEAIQEFCCCFILSECDRF